MIIVPIIIAKLKCKSEKKKHFIDVLLMENEDKIRIYCYSTDSVGKTKCQSSQWFLSNEKFLIIWVAFCVTIYIACTLKIQSKLL
jgi:hypothetical protein